MKSQELRRWFESRTIRALFALPPEAQVRLSGRPPVRVDGQTLDPGLQLSLALLERRNAPRMETLPPPEARRVFRRRAAMNRSSTPVGAVRDLRVEGAAGPLAARHYAPEEGEGRPLILYFHGGGFVVGDLETQDEACRLLCRHAGAHVLSVDYRLAPEHRFPAAVEDGRAALHWAFAHAAALGADPRRVAVAGDSAGGNLAAVASWQAARDGGPAPALQLLFYPATDAVGDYRSEGLFGDGFLLDKGLVEWFVAQYLADADISDPRFSVLRADDLSGLAPALVVTAGFDPLRDEGEAYAGVLQTAGVPVVLRRFPDLIHGFCGLAGVSPACRDALIELSGAARAMLETAS